MEAQKPSNGSGGMTMVNCKVPLGSDLKRTPLTYETSSCLLFQYLGVVILGDPEFLKDVAPAHRTVGEPLGLSLGHGLERLRSADLLHPWLPDHLGEVHGFLGVVEAPQAWPAGLLELAIGAGGAELPVAGLALGLIREASRRRLGLGEHSLALLNELLPVLRSPKIVWVKMQAPQLLIHGKEPRLLGAGGFLVGSELGQVAEVILVFAEVVGEFYEGV